MSSVAPTNRQLDELDHRLLELLAVDGRATMAELGRAVGLSRTAVLARVQRLEQMGVIRGYRAEVALPGPSPAAHRARVGLVIHTTDVAGYVRRLTALPGVTEVETVTGRVRPDRAGHRARRGRSGPGARHRGGLARDPPDHDLGGAEALHLTHRCGCVGARVDHRSPLPWSGGRTDDRGQREQEHRGTVGGAGDRAGDGRPAGGRGGAHARPAGAARRPGARRRRASVVRRRGRARISSTAGSTRSGAASPAWARPRAARSAAPGRSTPRTAATASASCSSCSPSSARPGSGSGRAGRSGAASRRASGTSSAAARSCCPCCWPSRAWCSWPPSRARTRGPGSRSAGSCWPWACWGWCTSPPTAPTTPRSGPPAAARSATSRPPRWPPGSPRGSRRRCSSCSRSTRCCCSRPRPCGRCPTGCGGCSAARPPTTPTRRRDETTAEDTDPVIEARARRAAPSRPDAARLPSPTSTADPDPTAEPEAGRRARATAPSQDRRAGAAARARARRPGGGAAAALRAAHRRRRGLPAAAQRHPAHRPGAEAPQRRQRRDDRGHHRGARPVLGRRAGHRLHPRPDGHALRDRARPGRQGREDHPAHQEHLLRGGHRQRADPRADPGQVRGRHRGAQHRPGDGAPRRRAAQRHRPRRAAPDGDRARQGHRGPLPVRQPGQDAAPAGRGLHGLRQVELRQLDAGVAAVAGHARRGPHDPHRPEDGRAHPVRGHPAPDHAHHHRAEEGRRRADLAGRGDGAALPGHAGQQGPPRRRLQPQGPRRARSPPRPAASGSTGPTRTSCASSTSWPTS